MGVSFPDLDLPEVALIGRSNVGKSSLLNSIAEDVVIARTSKNPGATKDANFFLFKEKLVIVDLPGYGYASLSKKEKERINSMLNRYFKRDIIEKVFVLIDVRRGLMETDIMTLKMLSQYHFPIQILLTKVDKLNLDEVDKVAENISDFVREYSNMDDEVLCTSAKRNFGVKKLIKLLDKFVL